MFTHSNSEEGVASEAAACSHGCHHRFTAGDQIRSEVSRRLSAVIRAKAREEFTGGLTERRRGGLKSKWSA